MRSVSPWRAPPSPAPPQTGRGWYRLQFNKDLEDVQEFSTAESTLDSDDSDAGISYSLMEDNDATEAA